MENGTEEQVKIAPADRWQLMTTIQYLELQGELKAKLIPALALVASYHHSLLIACVEHPEWARWWYEKLNEELGDRPGRGDSWIVDMPVMAEEIQR